MGLADDFERRLEQVVEGFFSKAFRSKLEPAEIGRRLLREMEEGKSVSVGAVYVPNLYRVGLAEEDYERIKGMLPALQGDFAKLLKDAARERRWRLSGNLGLEFIEDSTVKAGRFKVRADHDAEAASASPTSAPSLRLKGSDAAQEWKLDSDDVVIGRQDSADIMIPDQNVSRRHAQISRRDDGWWITDLGSLNDTYVNDSLVKERRLRSGDRIRVGSTDLVYNDESEQ